MIEVKFAGAKRRRNATGPDARQSRTNKALPFSTTDWETYDTLFTASVQGWVGSLDNSFSLGPSDHFSNLLQDLVDHFFPKYNIVVDPQAPIYRNVRSSLSLSESILTHVGRHPSASMSGVTRLPRLPLRQYATT